MFPYEIRKLAERVSSAIDESTIVSYWKPSGADRPDAKTAVLLDMVAGASGESSDSNIGSDDARDDCTKGSADDVETLCVDDGILDLLKRWRVL